MRQNYLLWNADKTQKENLLRKELNEGKQYDAIRLIHTGTTWQ